MDYWGFYVEDGFAAVFLRPLLFLIHFEGFAGRSWIGGGEWPDLEGFELELGLAVGLTS